MTGQTGGSRRSWLFSTNDDQLPGSIRDQLVHYDTYFDEDEGDMNTLAIVMDHVLDQLPPDQADAVRLIYLQGMTHRQAGRMLGVDHKTAKSRADKGVETMRSRLVDSVWIAEMLRGYIPADELTSDPAPSSNARVADVLGGLRSVDDESE
jgi:DNA-directed RNA polymerase specialized sigma24 family protein